MDGQYFEALQEKKHKKKTLEELCNSNWLLVKEVKIIDSSIKKSFIKYLEEYYYDNDYYFMDYIAKKIRIDNKILSKLGGEYCERKELKEYTPLSAGVSVKGRRYKVFDALEVILCDPCKYYFGIGYFKQALREKNFQQPVL